MINTDDQGENKQSDQQLDPNSYDYKMENMNQPNVDNRVTTDDVHGTKNLTFKSFGLESSVQFVSNPNHQKTFGRF